jgi:hypothetical protein
LALRLYLSLFNAAARQRHRPGLGQMRASILVIGAYLRGLIGILGHLAAGGSLDELHVGKMALHHRAIIRELLDRRVLRTPPLRPRHLDDPGAQERLRRLSRGVTIFDLLKE